MPPGMTEPGKPQRRWPPNVALDAQIINKTKKLYNRSNRLLFCFFMPGHWCVAFFSREFVNDARKWGITCYKKG